MTRITRELIRRRAEHNEGMLSTLEEVSLHQFEIEKIEVVGTVCRRLKILYLQNNVIGRMEGLRHLRELRYLNMALNNVEKIEGLETCEMLEKLDLTLNFIDLDVFEESLRHLQSKEMLKELFLVGNPAEKWDGYRLYVIAMLPQLKSLDGQEVKRTERILAEQAAEALRLQLAGLARDKALEREEKGGMMYAADDGDGGEDSSPYTPEARLEMYREMAAEREEKEAEEKARRPRERDWDKEHRAALQAAKAAEEASELPRQCNEGKFEFFMSDNDSNFVLRLPLPRFLDSSLLDADVHPHYVTVVVKNKLLRLHTADEVLPLESKAERSSTTGELVITMPKVKPGRVLRSHDDMERERKAEKAKADAEKRSRRRSRKKKKGEALLDAVGFRHITKAAPGMDMKESSTRLIGEAAVKAEAEAAAAAATAAAAPAGELVDDDDVPPLE